MFLWKVETKGFFLKTLCYIFYFKFVLKNKISFKKSIILLPWKELRQYCESHVVITWIGKMRTEERDGDVIAWKHKSGKNDWNERDTATSCFFILPLFLHPHWIYRLWDLFRNDFLSHPTLAQTSHRAPQIHLCTSNKMKQQKTFLFLHKWNFLSFVTSAWDTNCGFFFFNYVILVFVFCHLVLSWDNQNNIQVWRFLLNCSSSIGSLFLSIFFQAFYLLLFSMRLKNSHEILYHEL